MIGSRVYGTIKYEDGAGHEHYVKAITKTLPILYVCERQGTQIRGFGRLLFLDNDNVVRWELIKTKHYLDIDLIQEYDNWAIAVSGLRSYLVRVVDTVYGNKMITDTPKIIWASGLHVYGYGVLCSVACSNYRELVMNRLPEDLVYFSVQPSNKFVLMVETEKYIYAIQGLPKWLKIQIDATDRWEITEEQEFQKYLSFIKSFPYYIASVPEKKEENKQ